jgi:CubicO group peptidase (beta-lactamase class C family)
MDMRFRRVCEAAAEEWAVPALVVRFDAGGVRWGAAFGCGEDTRFRIASVTKPMTALLALGLLDLEAESGVWPGDVRLRHLLSHTSGFDCELRETDLLRFGDGDDALARCVAELPSVRRLVGAGEVWSYANSGYWLAGHLASERAGMPFEEALSAHVLGPAQLTATSFEEPELEGTGPDALPGPYPRARRPSGGLTSTAGDLVRFGRFFLSRPETERMRAVHGKPVGGVYGLGLFGERVGGLDVWGHSGSWGGFQTSFLLVPARDAVFVGLTNGSKGAKALRTIENEFFLRVIGETRREPQFVELTTEQYAAFEGVYENSETRYEVFRPERGDGLVAALEDGEHLGFPIGERTFHIPAGDRIGERFDFPRESLARFGSRLAVRVA